MKLTRIFVMLSGIVLLSWSAANAGSGSAKLSLGYTYLDEEGNLSVNQSTFNLYGDPTVSIEDILYRFDNGLRLRADLTNIIMNNRNLTLGFDKAGLFGVRMHHNQYRRFYSFDGSSFTRRHRSGGELWVRPHRYLKFFGGGSYVGKSGQMVDLFDAASTATIDVDYTQTYYNGGAHVNYEGRMFRAEFRGSDFTNNEDASRNQNCTSILLTAGGPLPKYDFVSVLGGFRRFATKYDSSGLELTSNRGWGGASLRLPENFSVKYSFVFDRTGSDSDLVKTDNVSHAVYATHTWPHLAYLTAGYQKDYNDDFEAQVQSNSFYFAGWLMPIKSLEFRAEVGTRAEEVTDGVRLVGDEDHFRHKFTAKYRCRDNGSLTLGVDSRTRTNDMLGSESEFTRFTGQLEARIAEYGNFTGGYVYSQGDFENKEQTFEFADHTLFGDITSRECHNAIVGFGATYYQSRRDLDVVKSSLRFSGAYRFLEFYHLEVKYSVFNFDDFLYTDQFDEYYTGNIVEMKITRDISL
ncbi:MAG: hypothetical protein KKG33_04800 [candidate division Zixibacteria bacterium]|nr:hypothetical protein [candidate division Zixibacteria bacterium]MBU1469140.1 hypothetical protein [candidate division Zixibacteria bacterium]MBU2624860.1 hypothetical protein [candidate division Zixibacteria bacterium]